MHHINPDFGVLKISQNDLHVARGTLIKLIQLTNFGGRCGRQVSPHVANRPGHMLE